MSVFLSGFLTIMSSDFFLILFGLGAVSSAFCFVLKAFNKK